MKKSILSAIQPTQGLHLGNYLGAIKNWVKMQEEYNCIFFSCDLHAITVRQDPQELRKNTYLSLALYLASGLDPKTCTLFVQSHVSEHAELGWILNCFSYMGELSRMTQFKDKSSRAGKNIPVGLFDYPILQAADILLYDAALVPVGADQKQHIELTRDIAERVNNLYGEDTFVIPEPFIPQHGAKVMSLQEPESKMSKSDENPHATLFLMDTDKQIEKKLKRAVTDSGSVISFEHSETGVKNLLHLQLALTGKTPEAIEKHYEGKQYGHLKVETAEIVIETLRPIREQTEKLLQDLGYLDDLLSEGAEKARTLASATLKRVYDRIGFVPPRSTS